MTQRSDASPPSTPWFQRRRPVTFVVALLLFVAVLWLRLERGANASEAVTLLFVLPIALLAVTFGLRGGVGSGLVGVALLAFWAQVQDVPLSWMGWLTRIVPLLLLGGLLGHAVDRMRRAETERRDLESAALLHRDAIEINDTLVQGMAAAKWALEAGRLEPGLKTLSETIDVGQRLVSELIRQAEHRS